MDVFDELVAEQDGLERILSGLDDDAWTSPSAAAGWSVADVVLHLAQTEEAVVATAGGTGMGEDWIRSAETVDGAMERRVQAERDAPAAVFARWQSARRAAVLALRRADPRQPLVWVAAPLRPKTLATTRLAEHWAHGLDITEPLGIPFPDTNRLRHIAWLGHATLPYAYALVGLEPPDVRCELTGPDGAMWCFGPDECESTITGPAGAFCRVGAHRLPPEESGLVTRGPQAKEALGLLRNYAG